jgi:lantibiotic modifying enzyme
MKKDASNNAPLASVQAVPGLKLQQIAACLQQPLPLAERPGFSGGQAGPFLFLYAYATHTGSAPAAAAAQRLLHAAVRQFLTLGPSLTYYRELAEFGTLLLYLREQDYLDDSFEPLLEQLDLRAGHGLQVLAEQKQFDPFVGYLPLAHYFLQRQAAAPNGAAALRLAADTLLRDYVAQGDAGFWYSGLFGKQQVYLGWSHGLAAILLFLTQLLATGFDYRRDELRLVLAGAARFLTRPHLYTGRNQYPDIIGQPNSSDTLNLCYGDLGIGFALLQAAHTLADEELREHALRTLTLAAARQDPALCNVFDASLIYGASGNALFFKYLQQLCPTETVFGEAAGYWYEQAQQLSQHPGQVAGYRGHYNQHNASAHYSLFEGLAGYGLVLLEFELDTISPMPLLGYPSCLCL